MEDPNCIAIRKIFVLEFLCALVESDGDLLLLFLTSDPGIKNGLLLEVEVIVLDFQSNIYFEIDESCRIERDVSIDVLLVVEATLKIEKTILGRYFHEFKDVLIRVIVFDVGDVL